MIDFLDEIYYDKNADSCGYEKERATHKALLDVVPMIMEKELTQKQNICLRYKYVNNKTQTEIAEMLKLSQPTVSRHISTAKDIVNSHLKYCYFALSKGINEFDRLYSEPNI